MVDRDEVVRSNRAMWNETAALHAESQLGTLLERFRDPGFGVLDAHERAVLEEIGVRGKAVAQLSCNNGRELLSVERLGAARCVGFDLSDAFVAQGRALAEAAGSRAEFVQGDVYEIPPRFDASFDLVTVTVGALGWLPDLGAWYGVVRRLLRPGGHLFIYEMHPLLDMFDAQAGLVPRHSYFRREPFVEAGGPDYYEPDRVVSGTSYWFHHTLGDVIGEALRAGLELRRFEEHAHDLSNVFRAFQDEPATPPLSYTLVARLPEGEGVVG